MNQFKSGLIGLYVSLCAVAWPLAGAAADPRGVQFIPLNDLARFTSSPGSNPDETTLLSPVIHSRIPANEVIASWNADMPRESSLKVEVRAMLPNGATRWYVMGLWSGDPAQHPRESVKSQRDSNGKVSTDTLILTKNTDSFQVRLTLGGSGTSAPRIKFLSLSLLDNRTMLPPLPPNQTAWGRTIDVPERSQMAYENGSVICSPTTVSMLLAFWSHHLGRPELDHDVPEVVKGVYDPIWSGTGNWVFNTAYAGSLPGMRAYTARLSDVSELEDFIAEGIPVGLSVCYNRLRGKSRKPSGHLVVCVGFTKDGDVVINDPGTRKNVRKTFPRANLIDAWAYSENAVYLIYPVDTALPADRFGHWDSATSTGRLEFGKP